MPAKNPRLTITLEPTLAAQLRRISELTGNSQSALISELLVGSKPVFARLISVLEASARAKAEMRGKIADDLEVAQSKIEGQLGLALEAFDGYTGDLLHDIEKVTRRARREGSRPRPGGTLRAPLVTPLSNRGVRSTAKKAKTSTPTRG